jgi:hypothetical protein
VEAQMLDVQEERSVIRPEEFAALVDVYKCALAQPWFAHGEDQKKQFAKHVILTFRGGMTNPYELKAHCLEVAKERYSAPVTQ